jgi:translation initiation factor 2 beta subunit (eIF-2beta)/eIF-5
VLKYQRGAIKSQKKTSQFKVFFVRDILSKLANTQYMLINFLEGPFLAFLLSYLVKFYSTDSGPNAKYLFRYNENISAYLFISIVVALFMGLTVSAEEIISDRKILKRETFLNLSRFSYLSSKTAIMIIISAVQTITYIVVGNLILGINGMLFDYWLVLFSCSLFANMLGLNISSAFNSVVTIYILIPILLIPQLLLSGVIVKFDKLNPVLSSQTVVPIAGELMASRWAFEALAVNQFKENDFERNYYSFDKAMSIANYKKNFWISSMKTNLTMAVKYAQKLKEKRSNLETRKDFDNKINLVINEMKKEITFLKELNVSLSKVKSKEIIYALKKKFTSEQRNAVLKAVTKSYKKLKNIKSFENTTAKEINNSLQIIKDFYIKMYNIFARLKNQKIAKFRNKENGKILFIAQRDHYQNESLNDLVKNKDELNKIIEFDEQLVQKSDPIYREAKGFRAHFFAPSKQLFGYSLDTFWINILVILGMTFSLFISLYFDILKRTIDWLGELTTKVGLSKEE